MTTRNASFRARPLTRAIALAGLPLMAAMSTATLAQDSQSAQSDEVEQLRQRVDQLEKSLKGAVASAPELTEDNPYILREGDGLKIGDTTISFGGFIKADAIFGSGGDGTINTYSTGLPRNFASYAASGNNSWKTGFSARESRFSFGTQTDDVAGHTLRTYLEMDFNQGDDAPGNEVVSNSYAPRLRQAYGNWNGWDFGQTYTTFTDLAALPEILNQGKMAAFIYVTQPMIRYNMAAPGGKLMVALENPEDGFGTTSYDDQSYPDLTARYQIRGKYGFYSIAGMLRNLEDDASDDEKLAGAVSLSARIPTIGRDDLRMQYSYGALGRYMGLFTYPDVDLGAQAAGKVEPLTTYGATVAYRHFWTPTWRSSFVGSHTEIVDDLEFSPSGTLSYFDSSTSAHVNLIWQASRKLSLGVEYAYWDFGNIADGGSQQYEQVMASAKMNF
ncbi:DcaP family trimeric outer membrane transporter [Marinobacter sp. R17]|uniref:DcaP family trimeric outer membrane transporter n=1 Tax=Marinobacter sp. R17 TaxID=2484250 RepID=UPI001CC21FE1|nr:DcaP family trimeric outer membrane transporter [Marinobacter sp. R17]